MRSPRAEVRCIARLSRVLWARDLPSCNAQSGGRRRQQPDGGPESGGTEDLRALCAAAFGKDQADNPRAPGNSDRRDGVSDT